MSPGQASPGRGQLPNFLLIGAQKAGTTSLYHYLGQHPEIFMSPEKEPRFFAFEGHALDFAGPGNERLRTTTTTLAAYQQLFSGVRDERAVGEASVVYLHHPRVAPAIAAAIPDAKIVAVLRNPVERAYSGFLYHSRDGYEEAVAFEEALRLEPGRLAAGWYPGWGYREQGFYFRHLTPYFALFPRSQIRVVLYEDLEVDPDGLVADLFGFLGVDPGFRPDTSIRWNPSGLPRSARGQRLMTGRSPVKEAIKRVIPARIGHRIVDRLQTANLERPPIRQETRADLVAGYAADIDQLEALIGRDLSAWRS